MFYPCFCSEKDFDQNILEYNLNLIVVVITQGTREYNLNLIVVVITQGTRA